MLSSSQYCILISFHGILSFKSVLAYSTVSQLSIMFIGLLIDPVISFNHMCIHAFIKSLLFLLLIVYLSLLFICSIQF